MKETNILLIDDDIAILDGFKELLEKEGYNVDTAATSREAVGFVKEQNYELILMDIVLKETTGLELIGQLKNTGRPVPIVMITAYPSVDSAVISFRTGALDYLTKPVRAPILLETVRRALERSQMTQEINELRQTKEKTEKANIEKSLYLIQVSHDIHGLMEGMIRLNNLLLKTPLSGTQAEYATIMKTHCAFLRNFSDNILDMGQIESGKILFKEHDFKLSQTVEEVVKMVYPFLKEKPVAFFYDIDSSIPEYLNGDVNKLKQILMNIILNAVHFTKEGEITLKARLMTVFGRGCHVFFSVKDTGIGIPQEYQMDIFKPLFKASDVAKIRNNFSLGMGLWICKMLVERMGGLISLQSKPDCGSEFRFSVRFNLPSDAR